MCTCTQQILFVNVDSLHEIFVKGKVRAPNFNPPIRNIKQPDQTPIVPTETGAAELKFPEEEPGDDMKTQLTQLWQFSYELLLLCPGFPLKICLVKLEMVAADIWWNGHCVEKSVYHCSKSGTLVDHPVEHLNLHFCCITWGITMWWRHVHLSINIVGHLEVPQWHSVVLVRCSELCFFFFIFN